MTGHVLASSCPVTAPTLGCFVLHRYKSAEFIFFSPFINHNASLTVYRRVLSKLLPINSSHSRHASGIPTNAIPIPWWALVCCKNLCSKHIQDPITKFPEVRHLTFHFRGILALRLKYSASTIFYHRVSISVFMNQNLFHTTNHVRKQNVSSSNSKSHLLFTGSRSQQLVDFSTVLNCTLSNGHVLQIIQSQLISADPWSIHTVLHSSFLLKKYFLIQRPPRFHHISFLRKIPYFTLLTARRTACTAVRRRGAGHMLPHLAQQIEIH